MSSTPKPLPPLSPPKPLLDSSAPETKSASAIPTKPNPQEIVRSIELQSKEINELATLLSQRIIDFETWLNALPGKVEAECSVNLPNKMIFTMFLRRNGKPWSIFFSLCHPDETTLNKISKVFLSKPLIDADLDSKMIAVQNFPSLLLEIKSIQDKRLAELRKSHANFESFAQTIGLKTETEGS